jgi:hypothetical protein
MKTFSGYSWITASMVLLGGVSGISASRLVEQARPSLEGAMLEVRSAASAYVPGELVNLAISVTNLSAGVLSVPAGVDVWEGQVEVLIAFEDGPFRQYQGPGWGLRDTVPRAAIALQPGKTVRTSATVLYSHGMERKHLNKRLADEIAAQHLEDGYALARPGRHRIKALLHDEGFTETIESQAIEITVDEPQGPDRDVWRALERDAEYGYFMQAGSVKGHPDSARSRQIVAVLEKIFSDFPASRYAEPLGIALSKHHETLRRLEGIRPAQERR